MEVGNQSLADPVGNFILKLLGYKEFFFIPVRDKTHLKDDGGHLRLPGDDKVLAGHDPAEVLFGPGQNRLGKGLGHNCTFIPVRMMPNFQTMNLSVIVVVGMNTEQNRPACPVGNRNPVIEP